MGGGGGREEGTAGQIIGRYWRQQNREGDGEEEAVREVLFMRLEPGSSKTFIPTDSTLLQYSTVWAMQLFLEHPFCISVTWR